MNDLGLANCGKHSHYLTSIRRRERLREMHIGVGVH